MTSIDINDKKKITLNKENEINNIDSKKKNSSLKKKKKKNNRCNFIGCNKKLSIIDKEIICKCKKVFCPKHRATSSHNCEYIINKDDFAKNKGLGGGQYEKLIKI